MFFVANIGTIKVVMFKDFIQKRLEKYVVKYFEKHPDVKLVVITGSVGKTSTKRAVGTLLNVRYKVRMHSGNHNTHLSAPLAILGIDMPEKIHSIGAWLSVLRAARLRVKNAADVDVIVQELGTDRPGDIAHFGTYLKPDIAVITAITPEHMEFFGNIDAVAKEELEAANFSKLALINRDDIDGKYAEYLKNTNLNTYGTTGYAEYRFEIQDFTPEKGFIGTVIAPEFGQHVLDTNLKVVGEHSLRPIMGAVAVATRMGMIGPEILSGLARLRPVPGRMNLLRGIGGTTIIDDTYNSSPAAAEAAVQTLFSIDAPQRIAVMGSMNELGDTSEEEHRKIGSMMDIDMVAWVVTIGEEAEKYLAPAARAKGCQVKSFAKSIDAGAFVRSVTEPGSVILVKGSQGGIYAEEAVKVLCDMSGDAELVRQDAHWMKVKNEFFSKIS